MSSHTGAKHRGGWGRTALLYAPCPALLGKRGWGPSSIQLLACLQCPSGFWGTLASVCRGSVAMEGQLWAMGRWAGVHRAPWGRSLTPNLLAAQARPAETPTGATCQHKREIIVRKGNLAIGFVWAGGVLRMGYRIPALTPQEGQYFGITK